MATWILLILMIDGGVDHIEMNSQQSCIEAREQIKNNNRFMRTLTRYVLRNSTFC